MWKNDRDAQIVLIYRHIAWINALRIQLRQPSSFSLRENKAVERLIDRHGERNPVCNNMETLLDPKEVEALESRKNVATQLVKNQGQHLKQLLADEKITEFDKQVFHNNLEEFYNLQGKCERIKNTPFPRPICLFQHSFYLDFPVITPIRVAKRFQIPIGRFGRWKQLVVYGFDDFLFYTDFLDFFHHGKSGEAIARILLKDE